MVTSVIAAGGAVAQDGGPPAPPHSVYGDVVDSSGNPVDGALVEITDASGTVIANDTTENGTYSVNVGGLDEGDEFTVSVANVERSDEQTLTWTSGASERVDLSVEVSSGGGGNLPGGGGSLPGGGDDDDTGDALPKPTAVISIDPDPATVGEEITFSAAKSTDEEREIIAYEWVIDGETYTGKTVTTSFDSAGLYDVELTVTNDFAENDTATETVTVEAKQDPKGDDTDGTGDDSDGTGDGSDGTGDGSDSGGSAIPGFGVNVALIALLAFAMLSLRRQH
ncbi:PKD domain-containing protein [Natrinema sp. 1APR25-10V2]|nr:PKD domain-containing protein [Natrinema sp. 1APR25-10V2]